MRVVAVPGRTVRHPMSRRVIDARGVPYDQHCVIIARYLADGDLALIDDELEEPSPAADEVNPAQPTADAAPAAEQE